MNPINLDKVKSSMRKLSDFLGTAAVFAAEMYGTTKTMAQPLVDRHFTPGNCERYGWKPIADSTLKMRANLGEFNKSQRGSGRDRNTSRGEVNSRGTRTTPAMVASGDLRNAMATTGRAHQTGSESAEISWEVPEYAQYHLPGGATTLGRPPERDFTAPNDEDISDITEFMMQRLGELSGNKHRASAFTGRPS